MRIHRIQIQNTIIEKAKENQLVELDRFNSYISEELVKTMYKNASRITLTYIVKVIKL